MIRRYGAGRPRAVVETGMRGAPRVAPGCCERAGCGHLLALHDGGGCALVECGCPEAWVSGRTLAELGAAAVRERQEVRRG